MLETGQWCPVSESTVIYNQYVKMLMRNFCVNRNLHSLDSLSGNPTFQATESDVSPPDVN